ncbi:MAG: cytochrome P450, partial [Kibdelosporangium sp.]
MTEPLIFPFDAADGFTVSETYRQVRELGQLPMVRLPYGEPAHLVTRYADVRFVLSDARFSRAAAMGRDVPRQSESPNNPGLLGTDPPDHTRLRGLIAPAFTVRRIERLRPWIRKIVSDLLADIELQG